MNIDKQRYAAVRLLEERGYRWDGAAWRGPAASPGRLSSALIAAADAMHGEIAGQIEDLAGCLEGSPEADELERLTGLAQDYEAARPRD